MYSYNEPKKSTLLSKPPYYLEVENSELDDSIFLNAPIQK